MGRMRLKGIKKNPSCLAPVISRTGFSPFEEREIHRNSGLGEEMNSLTSYV